MYYNEISGTWIVKRLLHFLYLYNISGLQGYFILFSEKSKAVEEKFQKLKEVYSKLRDEHIQLIRKVCC